uniref:NADH-ubiquinone oxidoreductase chain 6 n=1 Tax=Spongospora subterranea TaxID=70186 RepID=A0A096XTW8_9EUKA|nr:NADH dehydrogenase subunit 6 [Spongospora subterranea]AIK19921.1 NADH dehydrogenase subunit 6 [Spongospora subterranea]
MVILSVNPIHSALFLILVFLNSALLVLLLDLEFLSIIFILIYIGAIMVLFLFIIMMLDIKQSVTYLNVQYYFFISSLFLILLTLEFLYFLSLDLIFVTPKIIFLSSFTYTNWFSLIFEASNIKCLGGYLYTYFSFFLVFVGLILLVAMVGAISLTIEKVPVGIKQQTLSKQVNVNPKSSLFYIQ